MEQFLTPRGLHRFVRDCSLCALEDMKAARDARGVPSHRRLSPAMKPSSESLPMP
jgi:hypothetical protein